MKTALAALVLLATIARAGDAGMDDSKRMQGDWKGVLLDVDGKAAGVKEREAPVKVVVIGDKYFTYFAEKPLTEGTLKLDPSKSPGHIDAVHTAGPWKGMTQAGLYEFKGAEMKIVWAEPNKDRPASFKTLSGTGQVLLGYKRAKGK